MMKYIRRGRLSFVVMMLMASLIAAGAHAQQSNDVIWKHFLEWLPKAPPVEGARVVFDLYRERLIASGVVASEADRQLDVIRRFHRERPDGWRVMFNNIYATKKPGFSTEPNALLMSMIEGRKPGRALDIGMGQGRNSVFLALKGWDVTGFDMSDEGIAIARRNAERAGVKVNAIRETEDAFDYGTGQWDLVVFMYEPFAITSPAYVERLQKAMKPGAIIVVESFAAEESVVNRAATAIDPGRLLAAFKGFRLLHYEDKMMMADWGPRKPQRVVRMVAERRP
jgi:2-polyprenyl-3-methyl-5-hydroxy-6-metoxy-1,4-benzoquinol methylase